MLNSRLSRVVVVFLVLALAGIVPTVALAQTQGDVDRAEGKVDDAQAQTQRARDKWVRAQDDLEEALLELDAVTSELERLQYNIKLLENRIAAYQDEAVDLRQVARDLVVEAYTTGGRSMVTVAFEAGSIQDLLTSQVLIDNAASRDVADLDRLLSVSREMDRLTLDLEQQRAEVQVVEAQVQALVAHTTQLEADAKAAYDNASAAERAAIDALAKERREFKAAEARRAAAARASSGGGGSTSSGSGGLPPDATPGFLCPVVGGAAFANTWGAPRSGGRRHKGVDMFAPRNTPLQAVVSGKVTFSSNTLGGRSTHVYGDDGVTYYYAHLEGYPSDISSGQHVSAGTIVGYLGNSGNARYTSPHLHFEIRPGGVAVNPYPTVRYYCP
jgi:peptidoglycan LD-endopeptidase LytH